MVAIVISELNLQLYLLVHVLIRQRVSVRNLPWDVWLDSFIYTLPLVIKYWICQAVDVSDSHGITRESR